MSNRVARSWNLATAVLVAAALLVQLWIAVRVSSTPSGHAVGTLRGASTANRLLRVFSFFTIQSNIRRRIEGRTIALAMLWPMAWFIYILIYGRITKWYPYPFVDVTTHGYLRVVVNGILVVAVLLVVTSLFWLGDRRLRATDGRLGPADAENQG